MILLFGALFLSACQKDDEVENSSPPKVDLKNEIPIILIHGSGGDTHSLDEMADHLMNEYKVLMKQCQCQLTQKEKSHTKAS